MQERRLFQRFKVDFPIKFTDIEGKQEGEGRMIDISAGGGGMITIEASLRPATPIRLYMHIPDNREPLCVQGKVVWTSQVQPDLFRVGIQFENVDFIGLSRALKFKIA